MASSDEQRQHQHQPGNGNSREGSFSPLMQSIQQQPSQQHEDYDWMGVLDTLDDHFDLVDQQYHQYHHHDNGNNAAAGAGAEYAADLPTAARAVGVVQNPLVVVGQHQTNQNHGHDQECWQSTSSTGVGSGGGSDDNSAVALMLAAAVAARECSAGVGSISMSVEEAAADAEVDHRKQSRVERKRTREKKRRFDTNSQFTALAELVKEIEATDLAEEALFEFNKRYDNHGQEEVEEQQQHQNQVDERVGPNNSNDGHDASVRVSSVASGEKHSKKFKSGDLDNNNSSSSSNNNNNCPSSSSLLPMPSGAKSSTLLSSTSSSATSNRIDLIARTIVQLNHFRMLRRRWNNELRDCQRKNCELRKECEGLHRLVAQYKAMGKMGGGGYNRPQLQEKVRSEMLFLSSILIRVVGCRCCCYCLLLTCSRHRNSLSFCTFVVHRLNILQMIRASLGHDDGANDGAPRCRNANCHWLSGGTSIPSRRRCLHHTLYAHDNDDDK